LIVIWDNGPAHRGDALRTYLATPDLRVCLVPLPGYSPDYHADEAIWDWVREEVTANTCLGTKAKVREKVSAFLQGLRAHRDEVKQRCHTILQAQTDAIEKAATPLLQTPDHVDPTLALVETRGRATRGAPRPAGCPVAGYGHGEKRPARSRSAAVWVCHAQRRSVPVPLPAASTQHAHLPEAVAAGKQIIAKTPLSTKRVKEYVSK